MSLATIKPSMNIIKIGNKNFELKYNLNAFAYLEKQTGSLEKTVDLFNQRDRGAIVQLIYAGCDDLLGEDLAKLEINDVLLSDISEAFTQALPKDYKTEEIIDWQLLYYILRPLLNLSEDEFWNSTPAKLMGYFQTLEKYKAENEQENQNRAVEELMGW